MLARLSKIKRKLALLVLLSSTVNAAGQEDIVTYPVVSETASPLIKITPVADDGGNGMAFVRKPPGPGPFPAVLLVHGGITGWDEQTLRDYALHIHASRFLEAGYVVVSATRRDLDMEMPEVQEPVLDLLAIYDWLAEQQYVDPGSIVVRGTSVGGYLTLEVAAARNPAAIVVEEPFSFPFVNMTPGASEQVPDTSKIDRLDCPILLIRGDQTANLNDFNRRVLIPALGQADKKIDVITFPDELHSFAFYDNSERTVRPADSLEAFRFIQWFFQLHLDTKPVPLDRALIEWMTVE